MDKVVVKVQLISDGARLPVYASNEAAGADLCACLGNDTLVIEPHKWAMVPTGISIALPVGFEAQVRPRSGLAAKKGIT